MRERAKSYWVLRDAACGARSGNHDLSRTHFVHRGLGHLQLPWIAPSDPSEGKRAPQACAVRHAWPFTRYRRARPRHAIPHSLLRANVASARDQPGLLRAPDRRQLGSARRFRRRLDQHDHHADNGRVLRLSVGASGDRPVRRLRSGTAKPARRRPSLFRFRKLHGWLKA